MASAWKGSSSTISSLITPGPGAKGTICPGPGDIMWRGAARRPSAPRPSAPRADTAEADVPVDEAMEPCEPHDEAPACDDASFSRLLRRLASAGDGGVTRADTGAGAGAGEAARQSACLSSCSSSLPDAQYIYAE